MHWEKNKKREIRDFQIYSLSLYPGRTTGGSVTTTAVVFAAFVGFVVGAPSLTRSKTVAIVQSTARKVFVCIVLS